MYNNGPYPTHAGYQQGYAVHEEQTTDYPAYEPNGGPTREYNPSFLTPPEVQPNPVWPAPGQSNPVISNSKKRNNRKKRQSAAQGAVIRPVLRAAPLDNIGSWCLPNPAETRYPRRGVWSTTVLRVHQRHSPRNQGRNHCPCHNHSNLCCHR